MSTQGGPFQIINNEGIQDKLIMATDKLRCRIANITEKRIESLRNANPNTPVNVLLDRDRNWSPSLAEIEKTHILFVNATFKPFVSVSNTYTKTFPRGGTQPTLGNSLVFTMPVYGEFVNDAVVYIKLDNFRAISNQDKVRYIEMLGHRIFKKTSFVLNQQVLDSYTPEKYNIHWQFTVPVGKENGYLRNVGQEIPKLGFLTADPAVDEVREYRYFGDGPQTFKTIQSSVELWIPLLFWFKDVQTSLPNFLFPHGQTDIQIELESEANLVAFANYSGTLGKVYNPPTITECSLYLNHIYLLPEIHSIFMKKFGFQLVRVTRQHSVSTLLNSSDSILLNSIRWPIERMYIAFRPTQNLLNSQKWHRNSYLTQNVVKEAVVTGTSTIQVNNATYYTEDHLVSSLELKAHDIILYPALPPTFYNSYLPYSKGETVKTPRDIGWYLFNFCQKPGEYQPSGHFNASQDRELVLSYVSAINPQTGTPYIGNMNTIELFVHAQCINFLLSEGNSAVMRFST